MLSQLHLRHSIIPMDVFHMLEFLDLPYDIDLSALNARYAESITGSHIILFGPPGALLKGREALDAGLYEWDPDTGRIYFIEGASDYGEICNERQFIIIDGPPDTGENGVALQDPLQRVCRILFPNPIVNEKEALSPWALFAIDWVYDQMFP